MGCARFHGMRLGDGSPKQARRRLRARSPAPRSPERPASRPHATHAADRGGEASERPPPVHSKEAHEARIAGRRLRHLVELVAPCVRGEDRLVTELGERQDALGDWHDADVFAATIAQASTGTRARRGDGATRAHCSPNSTRSRKSCPSTAATPPAHRQRCGSSRQASSRSDRPSISRSMASASSGATLTTVGRSDVAGAVAYGMLSLTTRCLTPA